MSKEKILVVGHDSGHVLQALRAAGIDSTDKVPEDPRIVLVNDMRRALMPPGGGRWADPDPRIFEPHKTPKDPLIVLRNPTMEDRERIRAAQRKRDQRRERNLINEARQGLEPEGLTLVDDDWHGTCRSCGNRYKLGYDAIDFNPDQSYCGGSHFCLP